MDESVGQTDFIDTNGLGTANGLSNLNGLGTANGLPSVNGLPSTNGLPSANGLTSVNGLPSANGLTSVNGLVNLNGLQNLNGSTLTVVPNGGDMINDANGRTFLKYLIWCALTPSQSITRKDASNNSYTFTGQDGVAPQWLTTAANALSQDGEEAVTACLAGHINTSGSHCQLMVTDSDGTTIGSTLSASQMVTWSWATGSYFGNFFTSPTSTTVPVGFVCLGTGSVQAKTSGSARCYADSAAGSCPSPMTQIAIGSQPYLSGEACGSMCTGSASNGWTTCTIPSGYPGYGFKSGASGTTTWKHVFNVFEKPHNCTGPDGGIDN